MALRSFCVILAGVSGLACARLEIKRVSRDGSDEGLRFRRPAPYLLLTSAEGGGCVPEILWLPDMEGDDYAIVPHSGFGSVEFKPTLDNGWNLVSMDSKVDSKVAETLSALGGVLGAALGKASAKVVPPAGSGKTKLVPGLYRMRLPGDCKADGEGRACLAAVFTVGDGVCPVLAAPVPPQDKPKDGKQDGGK